VENRKAYIERCDALFHIRFYLAAIVLLTPTLALSQYQADFLRPFTGYYDSQSLTTAIGNATVAAGQVIPGRSSNPANLGLNRFNNIQVNFQHNNFEGVGASSSNTRLGGAHGVIPIPVYRGSLVFGGGVQKVTDFSSARQRPGLSSSEEGGMYATELGVSYEAAENVFIGGAFHYLQGSDELSNTEPDTNTFLNPKYNGYYFSFGFVNRTTEHLQIGASVHLPSNVRVREELTTWPSSTPQNSRVDSWNYHVTRPMAFHLGLSVLYPLYSLFYEAEWTDWQDIEFSSNEYFEGDVAQINRDFNDSLKSTLTHHLGAALHLPSLPLHLYGGYQYMPVPYAFYDGNVKQSLSGGASYLLNQQFSIHSSFSHYFWRYEGDAESYDMLVVGTSFHF